MLKRLGPLPRFLLGMVGLLFLLALTAGLWWWLPPFPRLQWTPPEGCYEQVSVSADGRTLLTIHEDRLILWDFPALRERATLPLPGLNIDLIREIELAPDGLKVALRVRSGQAHQVIRLWNPSVAPKPFTLPSTLRGMTYSADSRTLIAWDYHCCWRWDADTGQQLPLPAGMEDNATRIFHGWGGRILATIQSEDALKVWDLTGSAKCLTLRGAAEDIVVSSNGQRLAAKCGKETKVWDAQTGREISSPGCFGPEEALVPIEFSPDGRYLLLRQLGEDQLGNGPVQVWDLAASPPKQLGNLDYYPMTFSPDGQWLGGDSRDRLGFPNDPATWELSAVATVKTEWFVPRSKQGAWHRETFNLADPEFAPDGRTVAYKCQVDAGTGPLAKWFRLAPVQAVKVLDAPTGREIASLEDWHSFFYLPDGKTLATRRLDGTIAFWDLPPRRPWWIDYGLPVVFAVLLLFGARLVWRYMRVERIGSARVFSPGGAVQ